MKQTIVRKDGIVYERKRREPSKNTKRLCLRIDEETFNRLKEFDKPSKIIKELIKNYLENEN